METRAQNVAWHFEQQARRTPERNAVVRGDRSLTYRALDEAAEAVARIVRPSTAGGPLPISLLLDHGIDVAIGAIGVLKAGGICAPLDPSDPPARLREQVDHADAALVVAGAAHAAAARAAAGWRRPVVLVEEALAGRQPAEDDRPRSDDDRPPATPGDESPAWLYHTSGSRGRPKAVAVSHHMLLHRIGLHRSSLGVDDADRFTWFGLASTSQGGSNLLGALLAGGTLYPHAPRTDGLAPIPGWLRRERITVYNSSATLFRAIVSILSPDDHFPDLRVLRVGSERVRREDFEAYRRHCPPACVFVNRYSSTETGGIALNRLGHDSDVPGPGVPVGAPLPGRHLAILDAGREPVRAGQPGEIAVQSEWLSLGYWRDDEGTRAVFLPVPGRPRERLYLTGDLGRLLPDGTLEHLGRVDGRAKVRGRRVEVDEVENALARHPSVLQAAVCLDAGPDGGDRLEAYLVVRPGEAAAPATLRAWLASLLPASSVPAAFFALPALPLTPSGKLDRAACRSERAIALREDAPPEAPLGAIEQDLARVWSEVLRVPIAGIHDDFLALGGDSLQGMRILARVQDRWGATVSFEELLDGGTIAALAATVAGRLRSGRG